MSQRGKAEMKEKAYQCSYMLALYPPIGRSVSNSMACRASAASVRNSTPFPRPRTRVRTIAVAETFAPSEILIVHLQDIT